MGPVTAVVPVAGLGTRLRPLTHVVPKELLPLGGRPVIDHVVDELRADGVQRIVLVVSPAKPEIAAHLRAAGVEFETVEQPVPRGLGDAVLRAERLVDRPFVVACGDCVLRPPGVTRRLIAAPEPGAVALEPVEDVTRYGIAAVRDGRLVSLVEKPDPAEAPSRLAVTGRWKLAPDIFDAIRETPPGRGGELQLTDAIARLLSRGARFAAVPLTAGERRLDIGDVDSYVAAFREVTG